jgi:hypothetical protein
MAEIFGGSSGRVSEGRKWDGDDVRFEKQKPVDADAKPQTLEQLLQRQAKQEEKEKAQTKKEHKTSDLIFGDREATLAQIFSEQDQTRLKTQQKNVLSKKLEKELEAETEKWFGSKENYKDAATVSAQAGSSEQLQRKQRQESDSRQVGARNPHKDKGAPMPGTAQTLEQQRQMSRSDDSRDTVGMFAKSDVQTAVRSYSTAFARYLLEKNEKNKKALIASRGEMEKQGVTQDMRVSVETRVAQATSDTLSYLVRKNVMRYYFARHTKGDAEGVQAYRDMKHMLDTYQSEDEYSAGRLPFQQLFVKEHETFQSELKGFVAEEAGNIFSRYIGDQDWPKFEKEILHLQKISEKITGEPVLTAPIMERVTGYIHSLGAADFAAMAAGMGVSSGGMRFFDHESQDQKKPPEVRILTAQEKLEEKLRLLYMARALNPGLRARLELSFKIFRAKNGLIKLGIEDQVLSQVEKEGQLLARGAMLDEFYKLCLEQATLFELKGDDFDILDTKKTDILNRLSDMGDPVSQSEITRMQNKANREMFDTVRQELYDLELRMEVSEHIGLSRKRKQLILILNRLKEESSIEENIFIQVGQTVRRISTPAVDEAA